MNDVTVFTNEGPVRLIMLDRAENGPGSIDCRVEMTSAYVFGVNGVLLFIDKDQSGARAEYEKLQRRIGWNMITVKEIRRTENENVRGTVPSFFGRGPSGLVYGDIPRTDGSCYYQSSRQTGTDATAESSYIDWGYIQ